MQIATSGLNKFGTMVGGGGLSAVFDDSLATSGYAETFVGYAGVVLPTAIRVEKVEVTSASNGFDASGSTTGIELRLYGKNGTPGHADDGALLASLSFIDQNLQRTVPLESGDTASAFTHVWVKVHTGVWAVAAGIKFYEATGAIPEPEPEPAPAEAGQTVVRFHTSGTQLFKDLTLLRGFCVDFIVQDEPVTIQTFGAVEFEHRDLTAGNVPVGISTKIGWRRVDLNAQLPAIPTSSAPSLTYPAPPIEAPFDPNRGWVKGGKSGANIANIGDHYGRTLLCSPPTVFSNPGKYRLEVWGTSHTAMNDFNGNAQVNVPAWPGGAEQDPYNHFVVQITS